LEKVEHILPNGGLMVIYHGTLVENHLKQILAVGPVACKHFGFNLRILLASRSVEHTLKHKEDGNSKVEWYLQNTLK